MAALVWSLSSKLMWLLRSGWTFAEIILIIGVDKVTTEMYEAVETIMNINDDFFSRLMIIAFLVIAIITFNKGLSEYREKAKEVARTTGDKLNYGFNYLMQNIATIVLGMIVTFFVTGWLIGTGLVDGSTFYDCAGTVFVVAIIAGLAGDAFLRTALESIRDKQKAADALSSVETAATEQPAVLNELNKH